MGCIYNAWKSLYCEWQSVIQSIETESFSQSDVSESVNPIINSILVYPSVQRNPKPSKKKLELPKHMTCDKALEILKLKEEQKRNLEIAKESKRLERERKKKEKEKVGANQLKRKLTVAKNIKQSRKSGRKSIKKMLEDMASDVSFSSDEHTDSEENSSEDDEDSEDNECGVCGVLFQEGELWIQCNVCNKWFHVECTNQSKKGKQYVNRLKSWKCDNCS